MCGSSAQAPSCWRERRRGRRAGRLLQAAWPSGRACDISASQLPLHLNPSMALGSFSLSLLMQVHEAAAVVASGGVGPVGMREEVGQFRPTVGCLHLTTSTLPVDDSVGYSLSKSICDLRTSTRAPYVFAAPVRGRKVV